MACDNLINADVERVKFRRSKILLVRHQLEIVACQEKASV
jgi:hypothetical protein